MPQSLGVWYHPDTATFSVSDEWVSIDQQQKIGGRGGVSQTTTTRLHTLLGVDDRNKLEKDGFGTLIPFIFESLQSHANSRPTPASPVQHHDSDPWIKTAASSEDMDTDEVVQVPATAPEQAASANVQGVEILSPAEGHTAVVAVIADSLCVQSDSGDAWGIMLRLAEMLQKLEDETSTASDQADVVLEISRDIARFCCGGARGTLTNGTALLQTAIPAAVVDRGTVPVDATALLQPVIPAATGVQNLFTPKSFTPAKLSKKTLNSIKGVFCTGRKLPLRDNTCCPLDGRTIDTVKHAVKDSVQKFNPQKCTPLDRHPSRTGATVPQFEDTNYLTVAFAVDSKTNSAFARTWTTFGPEPTVQAQVRQVRIRLPGSDDDWDVELTPGTAATVLFPTGSTVDLRTSRVVVDKNRLLADGSGAGKASGVELHLTFRTTVNAIGGPRGGAGQPSKCGTKIASLPHSPPKTPAVLGTSGQRSVSLRSALHKAVREWYDENHPSDLQSTPAVRRRANRQSLRQFKEDLFCLATSVCSAEALQVSDKAPETVVRCMHDRCEQLRAPGTTGSTVARLHTELLQGIARWVKPGSVVREGFDPLSPDIANVGNGVKINTSFCHSLPGPTGTIATPEYTEAYDREIGVTVHGVDPGMNVVYTGFDLRTGRSFQLGAGFIPYMKRSHGRRISKAQSRLDSLKVTAPDGEHSTEKRALARVRRSAARRSRAAEITYPKVLRSGCDYACLPDFSVAQGHRMGRSVRQGARFYSFARARDRLLRSSEEGRGAVVRISPEDYSTADCPNCGTYNATVRRAQGHSCRARCYGDGRTWARDPGSARTITVCAAAQLFRDLNIYGSEPLGSLEVAVLHRSSSGVCPFCGFLYRLFANLRVQRPRHRTLLTL